MAKKTYIAQNEICGLEPPKKDKTGNDVEHVLKAGAEYSMDEDDAAVYVAGGSLVEKPAKASAPTADAV